MGTPIFYLPYILMSVLAWLGFMVAFYIRIKKTRKQPMVCYLGQDCDKVVSSQYSKFFGIPLELMGMSYYAFLGFSYAALVLFPQLVTPLASFILFGLTFAAVLFSAYLISVQAFALREWCTWCLTSALISLIIFIISILSIDAAVIEMLARLKTVSLILHLIGVALGVGAATISDIFFFRFLKDFRISKFESEILHMLSQVVWLGLGILVLSGVGLFLPEIAQFGASSKFLTKMIIVLVIITNGVLLNLYVSPRLLDISFGQQHHHHAGELRQFRKIAFAAGSISLLSWYLTLILGALRSIPISLTQALGIYIAMLFIAISTSQIVEARFAQHAMVQLELERKHRNRSGHKQEH